MRQNGTFFAYDYHQLPLRCCPRGNNKMQIVHLPRKSHCWRLIFLDRNSNSSPQIVFDFHTIAIKGEPLRLRVALWVARRSLTNSIVIPRMIDMTLRVTVIKFLFNWPLNDLKVDFFVTSGIIDHRNWYCWGRMNGKTIYDDKEEEEEDSSNYSWMAEYLNGINLYSSLPLVIHLVINKTRPSYSPLVLPSRLQMQN